MRQLHHLWLVSILTFLLLFLASCNTPTLAVPAQRPASTPLTHHPQATKTPGKGATANDVTDNTTDSMLLHKLLGPEGWTWRAGLPHNRLVIYYGNPLSAEMGPLGAYSDDDLIARLQAQAQAYADLDPAHPVVPALDYVTPVAQPVAMQDGSWVYRMPDDSIEHYVDLASANHMLFFFDMQIGHSPIQKEVNILWPYLQRPEVDLALDPEFDMAPGAVPGVEFGRMYASEVNWVIDQLSNLVQAQHLPPKVLIIHQFIPQMLPDWQKIKVQSGVEVVTCVDGFGSPDAKISDYQMFDKVQLIQYPGMKLFYKLDKPLMSPEDVLNLDPAPLMVMYQ